MAFTLNDIVPWGRSYEEYVPYEFQRGGNQMMRIRRRRLTAE